MPRSPACPSNTGSAASGGWCSWSMRARAGRARASISSPRPPARRSPATSPRCAPGILDKPGWTETVYRRLDEAEAPSIPSITRWCACSSLPGGFRLLVGRDLEERERLYQHRARRRPLVGRDRDRARAGRRALRHPPRAAPRRRHDRDHPHASWRAISASGCRSPAPATNSTGWPTTSTPCSSASRR